VASNYMVAEGAKYVVLVFAPGTDKGLIHQYIQPDYI